MSEMTGATDAEIEAAARCIVAEFLVPGRPELIVGDDTYYQIGGALLDDLRNALDEDVGTCPPKAHSGL